MTLQQARDLLAIANGDPDYQSFPRAYYVEVVNRAQEFIAENTHCVFTVFTHASILDQADYSLADCPTTGADRVLKVLNVLYDDDRLRIVDFIERDRGSSSWRTASSGTPKKVIIQGDWLMLDPPPDTADETIRAECIRNVDEMTAGGDVLQIRSVYFDDMINYGVLFINRKMQEIYALRKLLQRFRSQEHLRANVKFTGASTSERFI